MTDTTTKPEPADIRIVDHHPTSEPATDRDGVLTSPPRRKDDGAADATDTTNDTATGAPADTGTEPGEEAGDKPAATAGNPAVTPPRVTRPGAGRKPLVTTDHHPTGAPAAGAQVPAKSTAGDGPSSGDAA
ncbi:hypothetical protein [Streptomyces specialis]|uniref:hypothetical protein n=1 Tax=Streptomyces specialis TaxID=498367 RepID=UPI000A6054BF|nr:hypothetical protein [Streptomyces specialis]